MNQDYGVEHFANHAVILFSVEGEDRMAMPLRDNTIGTLRGPRKMPHIDSFLDGCVAEFVILRAVSVAIVL